MRQWPRSDVAVWPSVPSWLADIFLSPSRVRADRFDFCAGGAEGSSPEMDLSCLPIAPPVLPGSTCATAMHGTNTRLIEKTSETARYMLSPHRPDEAGRNS